jgi:hypothetical protein
VELSAPKRIAVFAAVVAVLAGLGAYLFLPQRSVAGGRPHPAAGHHAARPGSGAPSNTPPGSTTSPGPPGAAAPDIYQWLPFTQAGLTSAAALTTTFATHYGSYSYNESTQAYLAPMRPLISSQLDTALGRAYGAPGLAASRTAARRSATATASILALRAFGPSSLTFVVAVAQKITSIKGTSRLRTDYAVTVTGDGTKWQVTDIELSSAGNS